MAITTTATATATATAMATTTTTTTTETTRISANLTRSPGGLQKDPCQPDEERCQVGKDPLGSSFLWDKPWTGSNLLKGQTS